MHTLTVQKREIFGQKTNRLRKQDIIPGNLYGKAKESHAFQVSLVELGKIYKEAGYTGVIELIIEPEKKSHPAMISEIQIDPVTDKPIHVDFHQVNLKEKIQLAIPIHFKGESQAVSDGGMLVTIMDEIEVEAFPQDMPEYFVADISKILTQEDEITLGDLNIDPSKHTIEHPLDTLVARVEDSTMAEEEVEEEVIETEIINEKPDAESEEEATEEK